jgi:prolyl 4-hydroxylase
MAQRVSFQEALVLARSGDAEAQYAVSSILHERRQFELSLHWLRLAAGQNLGSAQVTLATFLIDGRHCPRDPQQAIALLRPLAAMHVQASLLLAELHGFAAYGISDRETALHYLVAAARMGEAGALRQLALLGIWHQRWELVHPLLDAAMRLGDPAAAYVLANHLASSTATTPSPIDWSILGQAVPELAGDPPLPAAEMLHDAPLIRLLPGIIHPLVLDAVIQLAAPHVRRSEIVDARTGEARVDPMRNSSHVTLGPRQHDHVLEAIERCIARVTGLPTQHGEFVQVLRYRLGEEFKPHVDYFNESEAGTYQSLADGGQRAQTVLLYLNDGYEGGHTQFPKLAIDIKGRRGDMLHFHNLGPDGLGHKDTLHAGLPVMAGEKWLLSKWIRKDGYPPRLAW